MAVTVSDKYYLQALDAYPYDLKEAMESLNYAISHNSEHAGVHCLFGQIYMEKLRNYELAKEHFDKSLVCDINFLLTYEYYSLLLIRLKDYPAAKKLIKYALKQKGINDSALLQMKGLMFEGMKKFKKAFKSFKRAYDCSFDDEERAVVQNDLKRIKTKIKDKEKKKVKPIEE